MWTLWAVQKAASAARSTCTADLYSRPLVAAVAPLAGGPAGVAAPGHALVVPLAADPVAVVPPPVVTSHNRTVPSWLPVARVLPSGLNATDQTPPACAMRGLPIWRWVATSHSRAVPSWPPVARVLPSGLNATDQTSPGRPVRGLPIWRWVAT